VLCEAAVLVLMGAVAGIAAAYFAARVLASMVAGAARFDPIVTLSIAVVLGLLAILAAWAPAARAAAIDPVVVLKG
jgi:ABC-type antimicrobial peptide transport system permease subunit